MASKHKRKRLVLINRGFQLRYVKAICFVGVLTTLFTSCVILYPLIVFEKIRGIAFLPKEIIFGMFLALIVNMLFIGSLTIYLTHRIAGPMFAIAKRLRFAEEGKYIGSLKTRDGDEMGVIVRNLNSFLESLVFRTHSQVEKLEAITQLNSIDEMKLEIDELRKNMVERIEVDPIGKAQ